LPSELLQQLKVGGRLVAIVGEEPMMRATSSPAPAKAAGTTAQRWDTVAPRLLHFPEPTRFKF
jgi:protein-L-isoaspartate(D-aspartate) O-methyltransferase